MRGRDLGCQTPSTWTAQTDARDLAGMQGSNSRNCKVYSFLIPIRENSMASTDSKTTTNHDTIKQWVESRGGFPATVRSTKEDGEPGILRIDFPGYSGQDSLERIEWDEFFDKFEENDLALLYQEETKGGDESRFCKLVSR
jgi:hypothetical protein